MMVGVKIVLLPLYHHTIKNTFDEGQWLLQLIVFFFFVATLTELRRFNMFKDFQLNISNNLDFRVILEKNFTNMT